MFIVQLAGHLGKDPETRFTPSGQKVTTFSIATNQRKGKEDITTWVRITIWGDRLDKIISFLKKGSGVIVVGRMNPPTSYTDKEGRTQISLEVTAEMLEFSPFGKSGDRSNEGSGSQESSQGDGNQYGKSPAYGTQTAGQGSGYAQSAEDDLPF